jgi:hypothetical protein
MMNVAAVKAAVAAASQGVAVIPTPAEEYPGGYVRPEWVYLAEIRAAAPRLSNGELGTRLGRSAQTVSKWRRDIAYQRYEYWVIHKELKSFTPDIRPDVKAFFDEHAHDMQLELLGILEETTDEKLRFQVATDWLDRAGHSGKLNLPTMTINLPEKSVIALFACAREAGLTVPTLPAANGHPI